VCHSEQDAELMELESAHAEVGLHNGTHTI
jgi:hypothetical protein